ncbi:MAG: hypothetical protein ACOX7K_03585 [Oscillospiraceae bacterium]
MERLEGTYPIRIGGETIGTLSVVQEGLMTVFSASCRDDGALIRLSVFDETGNRGYLGVMLPENGQLYLVKRLSRAGLTGFPETIAYAGMEQEQLEGESNQTLETEQPVEKAEKEEMQEQAEETTELKSESESISEPEPELKAESHEKDLIWKMQPNPWSLFSEPKIKLALRSVRGALTATEEGTVLLAIPRSLDGVMLPEQIMEAGEPRNIDGIDYVVFRL